MPALATLEELMDCTHDCAHTEIETHGYGACVADECDPRSHGCVTSTVECSVCGSRRVENTNQNWIEVGSWGPSRHERDLHRGELRARLDRLVDERPAAVRLTASDGQTASVWIDCEGFLRIVGGRVPGATTADLVAPLVAYGRRIRLISREIDEVSR